MMIMIGFGHAAVVLHRCLSGQGVYGGDQYTWRILQIKMGNLKLNESCASQIRNLKFEIGLGESYAVGQKLNLEFRISDLRCTGLVQFQIAFGGGCAKYVDAVYRLGGWRRHNRPTNPLVGRAMLYVINVRLNQPGRSTVLRLFGKDLAGQQII